MDPQSVAFQPRDDFWRFQSEMLRVQEHQAELADRVARLERKQEDDSRLKNVWGTSSPFPSVLIYIRRPLQARSCHIATMHERQKGIPKCVE